MSLNQSTELREEALLRSIQSLQTTLRKLKKLELLRENQPRQELALPLSQQQ